MESEVRPSKVPKSVKTKVKSKIASDSVSVVVRENRFRACGATIAKNAVE